MTTGLLLTLPFSDRKPADDAEVFAFAIERGQRELLWRAEQDSAGGRADSQARPMQPGSDAALRDGGSADQEPGMEARTRAPFHEVTLSELIPARDAGDVCHVCGNLVTWVDHLPPRDPGGAVRCFTNVEKLYIDVPGIDTPVFRALVPREV